MIRCKNTAELRSRPMRRLFARRFAPYHEKTANPAGSPCRRPKRFFQQPGMQSAILLETALRAERRLQGCKERNFCGFSPLCGKAGTTGRESQAVCGPAFLRDAFTGRF
jgi:hypothetical protein